MAGTDDLKKMLKDGNVSGVLVLYGDEEYLKDYYYSRIKTAVVDDDGENHIMFEDAADAREVSDAVELVPFLGGRKLVELRDAVFKEDSELTSCLKDASGDLPEFTVLLLYYPTVRLSENKTFEKKLMSLLGERAVFCKFDRPKYGELKDWVLRQFGANKMPVAPDMPDYLLSVADNSMISLKNEIEKIIRYAPGSTVTKKTVDTLVTKTADAKAYELTDALVSGKGDALSLLGELLAQGNDITFVASCIYNRIYDIYLVKLALQQRISGSVIASDLGIKSDFTLKKLITAAGSADAKTLAQCVKLCADTDVKIKSIPADSRVLLELCVAEIMTSFKR